MHTVFSEGRDREGMQGLGPDLTGWRENLSDCLSDGKIWRRLGDQTHSLSMELSFHCLMAVKGTAFLVEVLHAHDLHDLLLGETFTMLRFDRFSNGSQLLVGHVIGNSLFLLRILSGFQISSNWNGSPRHNSIQPTGQPMPTMCCHGHCYQPLWHLAISTLLVQNPTCFLDVYEHRFLTSTQFTKPTHR